MTLTLEPCKRCGNTFDHSPLVCPQSMYYGKDPWGVGTVCGMTFAELAVSKECVMHAAKQDAWWALVSCERCKAMRTAA